MQGSTSLGREDGLTLEELFQFVDRTPRFRDLLQQELSSTIPAWRKEEARHKRTRERKDKKEEAVRNQKLSEQLDAVRSGSLTDTLVYLANAYFGRVYGTDRDKSPKERLADFTTPGIAAAALDGFLAVLKNPDIPTPKLIGEAQAEGKEYLIGLPVLAAFDVLANKSFADVPKVPEPTLQSGLAFHYAIVSDQEREWGDHVIEACPDLAAEALMAYWRPQLAHNSKNIMGLYDLAHQDVMKPVARRVALVLLKDCPNAQEDNLELLLHAALRNGDQRELLSFACHVLARHTPLSDHNRALWYAVVFALDHSTVCSATIRIAG